MYKQGTSKRDTSGGNNSNGPSANAYMPNMTFTQQAAAKWGFGSERRADMASTAYSPGPGNYAIKSVAFELEKPRFFMG
mgnify:CR=1 FL=1